MDIQDLRQHLGGHDPSAFVNPIVFVAVVLLIVYLAMNSFYTVEANEQAVVLRFGKYQATTLPGLHFCIPLVEQVLKVSVEEHSLRLPIELGSRNDRNSGHEETTLMLTGDLNAASVEWTIQWKVSEPKEYLFSFYQPGNVLYVEGVVYLVAQTVMNRLVGDYSSDEVLTGKRTEIAIKAKDATEAMLDQYKCGVSITDLQMQRVTPPAQVKPAFEAVNSAVQERDKLENEANRERNTLLPKARAERDKKIRDAEGYAARRRAEVRGEISALRAKYEAYAKAPDVTRRRLYLESMQSTLSQIQSKTIIDSDLQQILPLLQLDQRGTK